MTQNIRAARQPPSLILVTDPGYTDDTLVKVVEACGEALPAGRFGVQLRDKKRHAASLKQFAMRLRLATRRFDTWLYINGDAQLAALDLAAGIVAGRRYPASVRCSSSGTVALMQVRPRSDSISSRPPI